jgi:hypothetical protein
MRNNPKQRDTAALRAHNKDMKDTKRAKAFCPKILSDKCGRRRCKNSGADKFSMQLLKFIFLKLKFQINF